jgi:hypothetical protein
MSSVRKFRSNRRAGPLHASAVALLLFGVTVPAHAITRIRGDLTPCAEIQRILRDEGAVVIRFPSKRIPDYFLYDRYVSPHYFCVPPEVPVTRRINSADNPRCVVHRCERVEPLFNLFDRN